MSTLIYMTDISNIVLSLGESVRSYLYQLGRDSKRNG